MQTRPPRYGAYLLRFWEVRSDLAGQPRTWRFTLEEAGTGKKRAFRGLEALLAFLQTELEGGDAGSEGLKGAEARQAGWIRRQAAWPSQGEERGSRMRHRSWMLMVVVFGLLAAVAGVVLASMPAAVRADPGVLYVKPSATGSGNCSTWANACELQHALSIASTGDEIWVMAGTYKPTNGTERTATFQLRNGVAIYGGFAGTESNLGEQDWEANETILSGDIGTGGDASDNVYHVLMCIDISEVATLDGLTISGGYARNAPEYDQQFGAGLFAYAGELWLENLRFEDNEAQEWGGGLYINSSDATLTNVAFSSNTADRGGGMYNNHSTARLTNCNFSDNTVTTAGGGMYNWSSSATLTDVTFSGNEADDDGGGMYNLESSPTLRATTFISNAASGDGGGMYNEDSSPGLIDGTFRGNTANEGGGMYNNESGDYDNPLAINFVTFISNTASVDGGGIYNRISLLHMDYTDFYTNNASNGGGVYNADNNNLECPVDPCSGVVSRGTFRGNTAQNFGGGMYNDNSSPDLLRDYFVGNTASNGGGMYNNNSSPQLRNTHLFGNTAQNFGGGMYNLQSSLQLIQIRFSGNWASDSGGGMYNDESSLELTNVTFSANGAAVNGGGLANVNGSGVVVANSILWGSSASPGAQIWSDVTSTPVVSYSLVQGGYSTGTGIIDADPLFVDADGADNTPGTRDDDLHVSCTSPAIDAGDNSAVPAGVTTDLDVNPRVSGIPADPDYPGHPRVDMGAYEEQDYQAWVVSGTDLLEEGRAYRNGFGEEVPTRIGDTIALYDDSDFIDAADFFSQALACAATAERQSVAGTGLLDASWELATGEMLVGYDDMVKSTDMRVSADPPPPSLGQQRAHQIAALGHFSAAVNAYLDILGGDFYTVVMALQPSRISPLDGSEAPFLDVQRLAEATARESWASETVAQSYFREYTPAYKAQAEATLREGFDQASAELALLDDLAHEMDAAGVERPLAYRNAYQALTQNISEMERVFEYLDQGKNPFGFQEGYIPFLIRYDNSDEPENVWNFLNVYDEAYAKDGSYYDLAVDDHEELMEESRQLDYNQGALGLALHELRSKYGGPLGELCGLDGEEIDLASCDGGTIYQQALAIEAALTRFRQAELQMETQLELIRTEQERAAKVAGIHKATAVMYKEDGSELATLARDEVDLREGQSELGIASGILGAGLEGFFAGGGEMPNFNVAGALAKGGISLIVQAGKSIEAQKKAEKLGNIAAKREQIDARQKARVEYAEAEIVDANSEALIKEYMLEYATLQLDRAIAYNALQQELHRLNAMAAQVEYLLARWAEADRDTVDIFADPGARLYRDWLSELAQGSYDQALEWAYRSSRALDYETGQVWQGADDIFGLVDVTTLGVTFNQMNTAFNDWKPGIPPEPDYTAISVSKALGFADSWEMNGGVPVWKTARQKFNDYVGNEENWLDLNGDGTKGSLRLTFQTSIFYVSEGLNLFSTGVYNDKILRVAPVLIGNADQLDGDHNNTSIRLKQLGTCYLRRKDAVIGGQDSFSAYDFEHVVKEGESREARVNSYHEWINDEDLDRAEIDTDGSLGLLWRSVGCTEWVLTIAKEGLDAENSDLDFAGLDDILLFVKHRNFALETPGSAGVSGTAGQPAERRSGAPLLIAEAEQAYRYAGTLIAEQPERLPAGELVLYLERDGSDVAGVVEAEGLLGFPVDEGTGLGPALSGTVSDGMFNLTSQVYSGAGGISRMLTLATTTVMTDGALIAGEYVQSIVGVVPETIEERGVFTLTQSIGVPQAGFSAKPSTGPVPLVVEFLDWSQGDPTSWAWDFGDGATSTEPSPTHTYEQPGLYPVTLAVSNLFGSQTVTETGCISVTEPAAPVAYFEATPRSGFAPLAVTFEDRSAGGPTSWAWDFGDGATSTAQHPTHEYVEPGSYTVALTVTNAFGSRARTEADYILVNEPVPPVAGFSASPTSGFAPLTVTFQDESTNDPTAWAWDFGDGGSSTEQHPTYVYETAGSYTVSLTASSAHGSDTLTVPGYITVMEGERIYLPLVLRNAGAP